MYLAHKLAIAALLSLATCNHCARADELSTADKQRQYIYTALHLIDWRQTMDIPRHPEQYETNVVLGKHPSNSRIHLYFASTLAAHYLIVEALPAEYRAAFQNVTIGVEAGMTQSNFSLGLSASF